MYFTRTNASYPEDNTLTEADIIAQTLQNSNSRTSNIESLGSRTFIPANSSAVKEFYKIDDTSTSNKFGIGRRSKREAWSRHKIALMVANTTVSVLFFYRYSKSKVLDLFIKLGILFTVKRIR